MTTTRFINATIYQGASTLTGSLVIADGLIDSVCAGDPPADAGATTIDLGGAFVLPGFVDAHIHLTSLALGHLRCSLASAASARDVLDMLSAYAREHDDPHIMGVDWDENTWADRTLPTRRELDDIDAARPVLARRVCGHAGVANTALLNMLAPHPGLIDLESGYIREHALWEAGALCDPGEDALASGIERAIRTLHALGITGIHDIVEPSRFTPYVRGVRTSKAPLAIDVLLHAPPSEFDRYESILRETPVAGLRLAGVKCFLDGSFGGHTAALSAPYDDAETRGTLLMTDEDLHSIVAGCMDRGIVCAMHAIGDRAIDQAIAAIGAFPADPPLCRIEHCELSGPEHIRRLRDLPVFLALQPNFIRRWGNDGGLYRDRLGPDRLRSCKPFRSFADAGIAFMFSSDGMPPGPLYGIAGATRHPAPEQRLSVTEAIDAYTRAANEIPAHRRNAGTLASGQEADLVILQGNPLQSDVDDVRVRRVLVGGRTVYDAADGEVSGPDGTPEST